MIEHQAHLVTMTHSSFSDLERETDADVCSWMTVRGLQKLTIGWSFYAIRLILRGNYLWWRCAMLLVLWISSFILANYNSQEGVTSCK